MTLPWPEIQKRFVSECGKSVTGVESESPLAGFDCVESVGGGGADCPRTPKGNRAIASRRNPIFELVFRISPLNFKPS
jgi:hypothetical protein